MLVTEFMEVGDLWRVLPLQNNAGDRIFGWYRRCACFARRVRWRYMVHVTVQEARSRLGRVVLVLLVLLVRQH